MRSGDVAARGRSFGLVLLAASATACGDSEIELDVAVPPGVAARAAWIEIGAYRGDCLAVQQLAGGAPEGGALERVAYAYERLEAKRPVMGTLPRGSYTFMATARAHDCSVLAAGCGKAEVGRDDALRIALQPIEASPLGACTAGAVCTNARCLPVGHGGNCSLALVGAGPLANPYTLSRGAFVSRPALAVTPQGFLLAYRELDTYLAQARLTLIPILAEGGTGPAQHVPLSGTCPGEEELDGIGLAFMEDTGLIARARPPCGSSSAVDTFVVDASGAILEARTRPIGPGRTSLAAAHSVTPIPHRGDAYWLTYTFANDAWAVEVERGEARGEPVAIGGIPPVSSVATASSARGVAFLSTVAPTAAQSVLRLQLIPVEAPIGEVFPHELPGRWGALAQADSGRTFVASGTHDQLVIQTFELDGSSATVGHVTTSLPRVLHGVDVAARGNRLFVAVEETDGVTLFPYDQARTAPRPRPPIVLAEHARLQTLATLRDSLTAIAASDTRVAIAWVAARPQASSDDVGGYAVFACEP